MMNKNVWGIFALILFVVSLWRSGVYGETTTKPLWVVFVVAAIASDLILVFVLSLSGSTSSSDFIWLLGAYAPIGFAFGLFSYLTAKASRKK